MTILNDTQRAELIGMIASLPDELEAAVARLDDAQLDTPYREGGWTARQVVHHLADSHMNAITRMKLTLTEERPTLKPYEQDLWAELADSVAMPIAPSVAILRGLHALGRVPRIGPAGRMVPRGAPSGERRDDARRPAGLLRPPRPQPRGADSG